MGLGVQQMAAFSVLIEDSLGGLDPSRLIDD
jgi:hypothetical protein